MPSILFFKHDNYTAAIAKVGALLPTWWCLLPADVSSLVGESCCGGKHGHVGPALSMLLEVWGCTLLPFPCTPSCPFCVHPKRASSSSLLPGCGAEHLRHRAPCEVSPRKALPWVGGCQVPGFGGAPLPREGGRRCLSQLCLLGLESDCVNTQQMGLVNRCWR